MMAEDVRAEIVASVLEVVVHEGEQITESGHRRLPPRGTGEPTAS